MKLSINNQEYDVKVVEQDDTVLVYIDGERYKIDALDLEPEMLFAFCDDDLVALTDDEVRLIEQHRGKQIIKLFNPFHDASGRFTTADRAVHATKAAGATAAVGGFVATLATGIAKATIDKTIHQKARKSGTTKSEIRKQKAISTKIGGKKIEVTYGQVEKWNTKANKVSGNVMIMGGLLWYGASLADVARSAKGYGNAYNRNYKPNQSRPKPWPKGATEKSFKKMYRDVARKYHPDKGGDTATMQKINKFYENRDWESLSNLHKKLDVYLATIMLQENPKLTEEHGATLKVFIEVLRDSVENDIPYTIIETDEEEVPPFVVADGHMIIDKPLAEFMVNMFDFIMESQNGTD